MTPFQLLKNLKDTFLQDKQQQQQQESKAKKMPVSSQRSCDSDPMEVVEKMRQMRQNRVLQVIFCQIRAIFCQLTQSMMTDCSVTAILQYSFESIQKFKKNCGKFEVL